MSEREGNSPDENYKLHQRLAEMTDNYNQVRADIAADREPLRILNDQTDKLGAALSAVNQTLAIAIEEVAKSLSLIAAGSLVLPKHRDAAIEGLETLIKAMVDLRKTFESMKGV